MGIIADVILETENIMEFYVQNTFEAVSTPLQVVLALAGVLSLVFIAINHIYNIRSVNYTVYITWAVRYACILSFALVWNNFAPLKDAIVDTPINYATATIASVKTFTEERYDCGEMVLSYSRDHHTFGKG
jgi:type IV secretion system protein VirB6